MNSYYYRDCPNRNCQRQKKLYYRFGKYDGVSGHWTEYWYTKTYT